MLKSFNQVCCIGVSAISLSYDDVKIFDEITKLYGVETPLSLKDSYEYSKTISNPSTANTERFGAENNTYSYGYGLVKYPL